MTKSKAYLTSVADIASIGSKGAIMFITLFKNFVQAILTILITDPILV